MANAKRLVARVKRATVNAYLKDPRFPKNPRNYKETRLYAAKFIRGERKRLGAKVHRKSQIRLWG